MRKIHTDPKITKKVWLWCQDAYAKHGCRLRFPKDTNPQKTYQWRYAARLAEKLEEWDFDEQTSKAFIELAVGYVKEHKLLRKGLSVFFQTNILQVCYDRIDDYCRGSVDKITVLERSRDFVDAKLHNRSRCNLLLDRSRLDEYANIVEWFESHKIGTLYLALSKSCASALAKLAESAPEQRGLLPSSADLFCLRSEIVNDDVERQKAEEILGSDWRELCLR